MLYVIGYGTGFFLEIPVFLPCIQQEITRIEKFKVMLYFAATPGWRSKQTKIYIPKEVLWLEAHLDL